MLEDSLINILLVFALVLTVIANDALARLTTGQLQGEMK